MFPPELPRRCIKAGTSERGCCPTCGASWERVRERVSAGKRYSTGKSKAKNDVGLITGFSGYDDGSSCPVFRTTGWRPTCDCGGEPVPCTILDPFGGAGTTAVVAMQLKRNATLIELNPEYVTLTEKRLRDEVARLAFATTRDVDVKRVKRFRLKRRTKMTKKKAKS